MAQLTITYDTSTRRFTAASVDGQPLGGVAQVVLGAFTVEVMDRKGRDLLAATGPTSEPAHPSVGRDIAACFGASHDAPSPEKSAGDRIDRWDFNRGSL
ncbi:MAG TPA: hypothetical protein VD866_23465 [Urbifossiella sp.]|nr:hypothetical protein [Urbifossiella sp.]